MQPPSSLQDLAVGRNKVVRWISLTPAFFVRCGLGLDWYRAFSYFSFRLFQLSLLRSLPNLRRMSITSTDTFLKERSLATNSHNSVARAEVSPSSSRRTSIYDWLAVVIPLGCFAGLRLTSRATAGTVPLRGKVMIAKIATTMIPVSPLLPLAFFA